MAKLKDNKGREWEVLIDVPQLKRVRERVKFDLGKLFANDLAGLRQLATEPEVLVDVLFVLVQEEAEKRNVSPEDFGRSLAGDSLEAGFDALMEALADFYPSRQAKPLRALLAKNRDLSEALSQRALTAIASLDSTAILNGSLGAPAASSESAPAPVG
jgi:hypothetical protein